MAGDREIIDELEGRTGSVVPGELQRHLLEIGLAALSSRALVWCAAIGGGSAWGYAVLHPEPLRMVAALGYSVAVFVPILVRDVRSGR